MQMFLVMKILWAFTKTSRDFYWTTFSWRMRKRGLPLFSPYCSRVLQTKKTVSSGGKHLRYFAQSLQVVMSLFFLQWNYWGSLGPWLALSHELGHNFNFDHDNSMWIFLCTVVASSTMLHLQIETAQIFSRILSHEGKRFGENREGVSRH